MEPPTHSGTTGPEPFGIAALRAAVDLYLGIAYPDGALPPAIRRRLEWPAAGSLEDLVAAPPFEKAGKARDTGRPVFALRLGNARYPHMKLQIQSWPHPAGYILSVNTHDQALSVAPDAPDAEAFRELQRENQRIKEAIELAWDRAGVPTFLGYLRQYIEHHESGTGG